MEECQINCSIDLLNNMLLIIKIHTATVMSDKPQTQSIKTPQSLEEDNPRLIGNNLVFYVVLPSDMYSHYTMSRWFQWMITVLQITPMQNPKIKLTSKFCETLIVLSLILKEAQLYDKDRRRVL